MTCGCREGMGSEDRRGLINRRKASAESRASYLGERETYGVGKVK